MDPRNKHICRVCGFFHKDPPWGHDLETPSFDICECCGVEFGYEDGSPISVKKYRQNWIANGAPWFDKKRKPDDWELEKQLKNIPKKYL